VSLALFVQKGANVGGQFVAEKLDGHRFRIRAEDLVRGRKSRRFGIHDLSPR